MTEHAACYQLGYARDPAGTSYTPHRAIVLGKTIEFASNLTEPLDLGLVPPSAWANRNAPNGPVRAVQGITSHDKALHTTAGDEVPTYWVVQGGFQSNNAKAAIDYFSTIAEGRQAPRPRLRLEGAAASAHGQGDFIYQANLTIASEVSYTNELTFIEFENFPPNDGQNAGEAVRSLLRKINNASARVVLGEASGQGTITINACNFAGLSPTGVVYLRPEDLGTAPGQIPTDVKQNTAQRFRFHPCVFIRRTEYVRSVGRAHIDELPLAAAKTSTQPFRIAILEEPAPTSRWLISVDGMISTVELYHPDGDLRRPRDIWNQVWVPLIAGSNSPFAGRTIQFDAFQRESLALDRLTYLEYARCLELGGETITQDDTQPPA